MSYLHPYLAPAPLMPLPYPAPLTYSSPALRSASAITAAAAAASATAASAAAVAAPTGSPSAAAAAAASPRSFLKRYEVPPLDANGGCPLLDWNDGAAAAEGRALPPPSGGEPGAEAEAEKRAATPLDAAQHELQERIKAQAAKQIEVRRQLREQNEALVAQPPAAAVPAPAAGDATSSSSPAQAQVVAQVAQAVGAAPAGGAPGDYYEQDDDLPPPCDYHNIAVEIEAELAGVPAAETGAAAGALVPAPAAAGAPAANSGAPEGARAAIQQLAKEQLAGFPPVILSQLEGLWGAEWQNLAWTEKLAVAQVCVLSSSFPSPLPCSQPATTLPLPQARVNTSLS